MVWVLALRSRQPAVLVENGVRHKLASLKQVPALIRFRLRSSAQPDGLGEQTNTNAKPGVNPEFWKRKALQGRESQRTVMFARERSTRGQMRLPSIAQRGEGRAGGWEWGVFPAVQNGPQAQRDAKTLSTLVKADLGMKSASSPRPSSANSYQNRSRVKAVVKPASRHRATGSAPQPWSGGRPSPAPVRGGRSGRWPARQSLRCSRPGRRGSG
jgi:hypothetical protein